VSVSHDYLPTKIAKAMTSATTMAIATSKSRARRMAQPPTRTIAISVKMVPASSAQATLAVFQSSPTQCIVVPADGDAVSSGTRFTMTVTMPGAA
jgi:hypothetical protein